MILAVALLTACTVLVAYWLKAMARTTRENIRKSRAETRKQRILLKLDDAWEWRGYPVAYR